MTAIEEIVRPSPMAIKNLADDAAKTGVKITQLGDNADLEASEQNGATRITLKGSLKGDYAYSFKLAGYAR